MPYYIVIGRIEGDDDDSMKIVACDNHDEALDKFTNWIIDVNSDADSTITEESVFVSWIIKCDTKPDFLCSPWGPM